MSRLIFSKLKRPLLLFWCLLMASLLGLLSYAFISGKFQVESNILKLLPEDKSNPMVESAIDQVGERSSRYWFFLLGGTDKNQLFEAADKFSQSLGQSGHFQQVNGRLGDEAALGKYYWEHRRGLLAEAQTATAGPGLAQQLTQKALSSLYSPIATFDSRLLQQDPLLLFPDFLAELQSRQSWSRESGWLTVQHQGSSYVFISALLKHSPFSISQQARVLSDVDELIAGTHSSRDDIKVIDISTLRFAADGVSQAEEEISTIGLGSSIGIFLLLLMVFRSVSPLLLSVLPIVCGYLCAVAVCWLVFGQLYLIALVMGTSLIGLCNDYAMHFFVDRQAHAQDWTAQATLDRIFSALTLGMLTSVIAFVGMLVAPFPGMQQLALFCAVGLMGTYLTVVCLFPYVVPRPVPSKNIFIEGSAYSLAFFRKIKTQRLLRTGLALALVLSVFPLMQLSSNDDIRLLQNRPENLLATQEKWRSITGTDISQQFFLVVGDNYEEILQREEKLVAFLQQQIEEGALLGYHAVSDYVPSVKTQRKNRDALLAVINNDAVMTSYLQQSGLPAESLTQYKAYLQQDKWLSLKDRHLLQQARVFDELLIDDLPDKRMASVVSLSGLMPAAMEAAWNQVDDSIMYVDKTAMVSKLFHQYRLHATGLLAAAYILIAVFLLWHYGPRRCFWVMLPPLSAAVLTIAIITAMGQAINLFHCLGLILVLGAGIDYTLFLEESEPEAAATWLTIILSAIATILSFGLLALSETAAVSAMGMTVLLGILLSLLLSPLASLPMKQ